MDRKLIHTPRESMFAKLAGKENCQVSYFHSYDFATDNISKQDTWVIQLAVTPAFPLHNRC